MKALITGGTGFIGKHTVNKMAQQGHELVCLVRDPAKAEGLEAKGARVVQGDVTDPESLAVAVQGCDWVINLANIYTMWEPDDDLYHKVNVQGTQNVMQAASEAGVDKVVHVSTIVCWGNTDACPFSEATPPGSKRFSSYAESKHQGDLAAWRKAEETGLPLVMVYPAGVWGPDDPKASGELVKNLVDGKLPAKVFPKSMYSMVDVRDCVEVIVRAAEKPDNLGEGYIACGHSLSFGELMDLVCEVAGVDPPKMTMPGWLTMANAAMFTTLANLTNKPPILGMASDTMRTMRHGLWADGSKARRELGIEYTPLRETLQLVVDSVQG